MSEHLGKIERKSSTMFLLRNQNVYKRFDFFCLKS